MLARTHSWLDRHPIVGDSGLALALLVVSISTLFADGRRPGAAEVAATVVLCAPLALRRRAPEATFAAVMLACAAEVVLVDRFLAANAAALVALYTLVAYAPRRVAALGCAVAFAGTLPFAAHFDELAEDGPLLGWLVLVVHLALAAALGDRRRVALAGRAAAEDRARLLGAELERQAELAGALERERIARELHDVVGHALAVVVAQADGGRYAGRTDPGAAVQALETIGQTAREALTETRRAVGALREDGDGERRPAPGAGDVRTLVERIREAGLAVELDEEGRRRPLAPGEGMTVYRVVQEALTNVLRHAGRDAHATVLLRWHDDAVTLVVRDDGGGRAAAAPGGAGRGLSGMRARVEPAGGRLTAGRRPEGGFEVRATIPVGGRP